MKNTYQGENLESQHTYRKNRGHQTQTNHFKHYFLMKILQ